MPLPGAINAKDFSPLTDHQRYRRSVSAMEAASDNALFLKANGAPVDPDVAPSITLPAMGGGLRLNSLRRFFTASARVRIGISDQASLILWIELRSRSILSR